MQEGDDNIDVLNASMLHVLKEHSGKGVDKQMVSWKRGKKIVSGQTIVSLNTEDAPVSSKENTNSFSEKKESMKKNLKGTNNVEKSTVENSRMMKAMIVGWFVISCLW